LADSDIAVNQSAGSTGGLLRSVRLRVKEIASKRYAPILIIALILLLALFLRSYYVYGLASDNGWLMSGGSDSYYYHRLIDNAATTGEHLHRDPMLNFPDGARNPRPPLYTFSVAVPAVIFQPLFASLDDSVGFFFIMSSAFWGALTVIPVYLIAKEIFGRRTGYLAALFLAIMPSDVERSVATLCDHDPFALFFIVLTVYFLMKALKAANTSRWVDDWTSMKSIGSGISMLFSNNRKAVLYALLAGLSFSCIAIAWVGFTYLEVILLASFLIEILINKFKGIDSTTHTMLYLVMFGFGFLVTYPVYHQMDLANMDVPVYLFFAAFVVGVLFSLTRDLPWIVVLPMLAVVLGIALALVMVVYPALGEAIFTGQGYFSTSKLYQTIAEAKAPIFSQLALSFGIVTFYLSMAGLALMLWKIPKRVSGDYIIITVWMAVAIFMATSAGRFVFNAAPAFALSCAWITILIIDRLDFRKAGKMMAGSSGSRWQVLKKSLKIRHVVGALFLVFMLITPNLWSSIDAGIPMESKAEMDKEVVDSLPAFLRPEGYANGSVWYFGSFGYNLPLPSNYFPAFWDWFSQQDSDIQPAQARPAYVSWWDYGFESIDVGKHPAVADNFQQGYQAAGNMLLASSEEQVIGMMIARMIVGSMSKPEIPQGISDALTKYGASPTEVKDVVLNSSKYRDTVLENPDIYDPATSDISSSNIIWRYLGVYFANLTLEVEVNLYKEIGDYLGQSIGYIAVDSRLLPKSYNDVGVFYAPCKLTDRYIDQDGNPSDYFVIRAIDEDGNDWSITEAYYNGIKIVDYKLVYSWRFYETMLYRAYAGYSPLDAGEQNNDGIPGLSGTTAQMAPLPGWNLTHFMMDYRTSYFNPESDGSGEWQAISTDLAIEYDTKIKAGEMNGLVDLSPVNAYQAGVLMLKYYDGAILTGRITTGDGAPASGVRVTVQDKWGVPHQVVVSDNDGIYTLILPPGNDLVMVTTGVPDTKTLVANRELTSFAVNVSEDAAMRRDVDADGNGLPDWRLVRNIEVPAGTLSGNVFWDTNRDGNYTSGSSDVLIKNATIIAHHIAWDVDFQINAMTGQFKANLTTGLYRLDTSVNGVNKTGEDTFLITAGVGTTRNILRSPAKISGTVVYEDGSPAKGVQVSLAADAENLYPSSATAVTNSSGGYYFNPIMPGQYILSTNSNGGWLMSFDRRVELTYSDSDITVDLMLKRAGVLKVNVLDVDGLPFPYAHVRITDDFDRYESTMLVVDDAGWGAASVPVGTYSLIVSEPTGSGMAVGGVSALVTPFEYNYVTIALETGIFTYGRVTNATKDTSSQAAITFQNGTTIFRTSGDSLGYFRTYLPYGEYEATFTDTVYRLKTMMVSIPGSLPIVVAIDRNTTVYGQVWYDQNGNGTMEATEYVSFADVSAVMPDGAVVRTKADFGGRFELGVPTNTMMSIYAESNGYEKEGPMTIATTSANQSIMVEMNLAPILMDGIVEVNGVPLGGILVEFFNDTRYVNFTSDIDGTFNVSIYPGIYNVKVALQTAPGSPAYYYYNKMLQVLEGTNIHAIEIDTEVRLKVDGSIIGVPASRSVKLHFEGPSQTSLNVFGTYETYLAAGDYIVYAYDADNKQLANLSRFEVTSTSTNLPITLGSAYELTVEPQIGQREGNTTLMRVTAKSSGIVFNITLQHGNPYLFVLPVGEYTFYFEMRSYEGKLSSERFYLLTNETDVLVDWREYVYPVMKEHLDNSSLSIRVLDQNDAPVSAELLFLESDVRAIYASYTSDANGRVNSTIHPGPYTIYMTDSLKGVAYFGHVLVRHLEPVFLNITASKGHIVTVTATAQGSTELANMILTISNMDNEGLIKNSENFGTNSVSTVLPTGNYSILAEAQRLENGEVIKYSGISTVSVSSDAIVNMALIRSDQYRMEIGWNSSEKATAAIGESVTYTIRITNTGNVLDSYNLTGSGAGFSFSFPSKPVEVDFGTHNVAYVPVTVTVDEDAKVDHQNLYVFATSNSNSSISKSVMIEIDVLPHYEVTGLEGIAGNVNGTEFYREVTIQNSGNIQDNYTLTILNADELLGNGWSVKLNDRDRLTGNTSDILPGSADTAKITLTAIRSAPKANVTVALMIVSNSSFASAVVLVSPQLPDLAIEGTGAVTGDNVFAFDIFAQRDAENMVLLAVMLALLASIFIMRKIRFGRFFR